MKILIENNMLDVQVFKELMPTLKWIKYPRKLGLNHKEFFFSASLEDDQVSIRVMLRPSGWLQVSESFKNRMPNNGSIPVEGYKGHLVDWGSTVEVKASDTLMLAIEKLSKAPEIKKYQEVDL
jgi:hypothetical protein